jgi:CubicO group peptidase (beta-lactamase class C family)
MIENMPNTFEAYEKYREMGNHIGMQLYVSQHGDVVFDDAVGLASVDPENPLTRDDWVIWKSATKPPVTVCAAQLWEQGKLDLDAPVAETIPEFGAHGKESITARHILTHTCGFSRVHLEDVKLDWDAAIRRVCESPVEDGFVVGETAAYHPQSSWFILAELIHRIDGRPFPDYVLEEVFIPTGMDHCSVGMSPERFDANQESIALQFITAKDQLKVSVDHEKKRVCACMPYSNGRGPMHQLGRLYEMLLNGGELDGTRVLKPETVDYFTSPHRPDTMDKTFQYPMVWGLGFIIDSKHHGNVSWPYGYGRHSSSRAYGHGGRQSVISFADPEYQLVVQAYFNGMPGEGRHHRRARDVATAIYEDLGLT